MNISPRRTAPLTPDTLADQAYFAIEEMIVTLQLEPGEIVTEQSFKDKHRVQARMASQEAVRE